MTQLARHICAIAALPVSPTDRIELIPIGAFQTADGRNDGFRLDDPAAVIAASFAQAPGRVLPIDFDHRSFAGQGSADSRAAGWITGMEVAGDRIVASVEWTAEGRAALEGRSYRFISPVFGSLPDGRVVLIEGAGLVNNPALPQLRQLASKETNMTPIEQIAGALGLPADQPDAIVARVTALAAADTQLASVIAAARVTGDDAVTQICARLAAPAPAPAQPDPAQFVPIGSFTSLQTQLAALQKQVTDGRVEAALEKARDEGKLTPDLEGWATQLASKDLGQFEAWAAVAPVRIDLAGARQLAGRQPPTKAAGAPLTSLERQVASKMGVSEADYIKSRDAAAQEV